MDDHVDGRLRKGRVTRDALVAAGRDLFGRLGYEGTSIEAILDAGGISRGALYHHFATKAELFDAVLERETAALADVIAQAARRAPDPLGSLRAGCDAFLHKALDPAVQRIALLDPPGVVGWERWRELDRKYILGGLRVSLERLARSGSVPPAQVTTLSHMLLAAVGEAAMVVAAATDPDEALSSAQDAVDTLLTRLLSPPADHRR